MDRIERDNHHTLHRRKLYEVYDVHRSLRENPSLIAHRLARSAHNLLHLNTADVPLLSYHTALYATSRLDRDLGVLDGIDALSKLVEQSAERPKIKPLEIDQDALAIRALREQIPYIKEGLPNTKVIIDLGQRDIA